MIGRKTIPEDTGDEAIRTANEVSAKIDYLQNQIEQISKAMPRAKANYDLLVDERDKLKRQLEFVEEKYEALKEKHETLVRKYNGIRGDFQFLCEENQSAQRWIDDLHDALNNMDEMGELMTSGNEYWSAASSWNSPDPSPSTSMIEEEEQEEEDFEVTWSENEDE